MHLRKILTFFLILVIRFTSAQVGGESTYQFLDLSHSARMVALGGFQVAVKDSTDLNLPFYNPSLLAPEMSNQLLVSYVNYFSGINFGYAAYSKTFTGIGNFSLGIHYINYGDFVEATESGEITGNSFNAAEYAFTFTYSNTWERLNYGATLKPILSVFEKYQSVGLALDAGASYGFSNGQTMLGLVARNLGTQFTTYYSEGSKEKIPFNLMAGLSHSLSHAPLVLCVTAVHLNHWDLAYDESENEETGEFNIYAQDEPFTKQLMRHLIWGVEILPAKNFTLRAGYNYQRRQELKLEERASTAGFSIGFGIKVNRFRFDFATSRFHVAGSSNVFSLAVNLN